MSTLFQPVQMGDLLLQNRIVMAPLTRNRAGENNIPTDLNTLYYKQRASAGLLITEGSQISPYAVGYPATPGIHSQEQVAGWKKITDSVHAEGGLIFIQLWHVGRVSHPSLLPDNALPVAPSAICPQGQAFTYQGLQDFVTPKALSKDEIQQVIADYVTAAENAKQAGFDGVEIHAANGYLLDQFLRDGTNQRDDNYGGNVENRMRLLNDVITAVAKVWPANKIGVRLSPENQFNDIKDSQAEENFSKIVTKLNDFNLAYLHVLEGDMLTGEKNIDYQLLRKKYTGLYMANNAYDKEMAEKAVETAHADLVAFGRLFIANPDLPERLAQDAALNEPDQATFYGGDEKGYTDYPSL